MCGPIPPSNIVVRAAVDAGKSVVQLEPEGERELPSESLDNSLRSGRTSIRDLVSCARRFPAEVTVTVARLRGARARLMVERGRRVCVCCLPNDRSADRHRARGRFGGRVPARRRGSRAAEDRALLWAGRVHEHRRSRWLRAGARATAARDATDSNLAACDASN